MRMTAVAAQDQGRVLYSMMNVFSVLTSDFSFLNINPYLRMINMYGILCKRKQLRCLKAQNLQ